MKKSLENKSKPFIPCDYISNIDCIEGMKTLPDNCVDIIIADPPYNLSKSGNWKWDNSISLAGMGGKWNITNENWDNMSFNEYFNFSLAWLKEVKRILKPTGSMWIFGTYHNIGIINVACQLLGIEIINEVIWYKKNAFPNLSGRRLTASHETILWAHSGSKKREYYFDYNYSKNGEFVGDDLKIQGKQKPLLSVNSGYFVSLFLKNDFAFSNIFFGPITINSIAMTSVSTNSVKRSGLSQ